MSVSKHYLNKEKTKFNWRVVVYIPTGEYDRFGKPIKKHLHVGYYSTKSEGEVAERKFWNDFEAGTLELNKDAKFGDVILYFLDFAKNEGKYAKGTICNYEGYLKHHFQMLQYVPVKNLTPNSYEKLKSDIDRIQTFNERYLWPPWPGFRCLHGITLPMNQQTFLRSQFWSCIQTLYSQLSV